MSIVRMSCESIESMLKRFKKEVAQSGIFREIAKHAEHEKPSTKRKNKSAAARVRRKKDEGKNA